MESILLVRHFCFWGEIVSFSSILFGVGPKTPIREDCELR